MIKISQEFFTRLLSCLLMPLSSASSTVALYHPHVAAEGGFLRLVDISQEESLRSVAACPADGNCGGDTGSSSYLAWSSGESLVYGAGGSAFGVLSAALCGEVPPCAKPVPAFVDTTDVATLPDGRLVTSSLTSGVRLWSPVGWWCKSRSPNNPNSTLSIHAATAVSGMANCEAMMWGTQSGCVQLVKLDDLQGVRYEWKIGQLERGGVAALRCTEVPAGSSFSMMTDDYSIFVGDVHACGNWTHIIPSEISEIDRGRRSSSSLLAPSPCNESLLVAAVTPSRVIRFADVRQKKLLKDLKLLVSPTSVSLRVDGASMAVGSENAALVYDLRSLKSPMVKFEDTPARNVAFYRHYHIEEEPPSPKTTTPRGKEAASKSMTPHTQRLAGMLRRIGAPTRPASSDTTNNSIKSALPLVNRSSNVLDESSREIIGNRSIRNEEDEDDEKSPSNSLFPDRRGSQSSIGGISMRKLMLNGGGGDGGASAVDMEMLVSSLNRMHVETIGKLRYLEMRQKQMEDTLSKILDKLDK